MKKLSFLEAAYEILKRENKPLSPEEITKIALKDKLIETSGVTPERTMGAQIYVEIKRKGEKSRFIKEGKGLFGLREWKGHSFKRKIIKSFPIEIENIIKRLQDAQFKSHIPTEFEEVLKESFEFLGFEAELIGGSGDTDILLTANIGQESYKVNVDGKTSKSGKIIDRQIDWLSLRDHKEKNNADFIVVIGPKFSGGNLEQRAKEYNVSLLKTEDLIKILKAHSKFPLTLLEIKDLFTYSGDLSARIEDILTQNYSRRNLLEQFRIIIEEMESIQDRLGYFSFDSLVGREKIEEMEVPSKDIDDILRLLRLPFINGIKEVEQGKYILTMKIKDIEHIFNQISELLIKEKPITEPTNVIPSTEIKTLVKLGSKYFKWYIKEHSIIGVARKENPYEHYCPLEHFKTIFEVIKKSFKENNVINTDLIFSKLERKELAPNRIFKGKSEEYKVRMTLGILEIENLIKWTGSKRPIEFKLNTSLENLQKWFEKTFRLKP